MFPDEEGPLTSVLSHTRIHQMSHVRYSKYIPHPLDQIDLESLINQLKDFFLESGFYSQFYPHQAVDHSLQGLYRALAEILSENELLPEEWQEVLEEYVQDFPEGKLPEKMKSFLDQLIQRLEDEGYLRASQEGRGKPAETGTGSEAEATRHVKFELTDKSIDFLGYQTLRDLMSSLGRTSWVIKPSAI